jgi:ribonuclease HI
VAKTRAIPNLDEEALNIFTDGSSYSTPRRGGIGFRLVFVDISGDEQVENHQPPGYRGATNQQMEL